MKVKWLGHSCFLITSERGIRIITDPYAVGGGINYSPVKESADIVVVSHGHGDHANVTAIKGKPEIVRDSGLRIAGGIQFKGTATYHDASQGKQRGSNTIFCFNVDGIEICHLGDLGHVLSPEQIAELGVVDILLIPVGGFYTIDGTEASQICDQLKPRIIIPMHYKTSKCAYPIAEVDDFLKGKTNVKRMRSSEAEFEHEKLPVISEIVLLQPAL